MTMQPLIKYETVGRRLTTSEVDGNWDKLEDAIASLEGGGVSIVGIDLTEDASGARLVFIGSNGGIVAEVAFPAAIMSAGEWTAGAAYTTRDLATHSGGTYLCIVAHTAGADLDSDVLTGKWIQLGAGAAAGLSFNGGPYGLEATTMQDAIVEVNGKISAVSSPTAEDVTYDHTGSGLDATSVQAALDEIAAYVGELEDSIGSGGSGTDDQTAAEVAFTAPSGMTSTNVQAAIEEVKGLIPLAGTDDQTASEVPFTPSSGITATNVQAAIVQVKGMIPSSGGAVAASAVTIPTTGWTMIGGDDVLEALRGCDSQLSSLQDAVLAASNPENIIYGGGNAKNALDNIFARLAALESA